MQSILARGYWNPPSLTSDEQRQAVQRVVQQAKLAEKFQIVAPARQFDVKLSTEENYTVYPRPGAPRLTKRDAGYVARGPFGCENCRWYKDGGCAVTGTSVEARGCCDLWNEPTAPKGVGKERAEYIYVPDSEYTCAECKVYDPSIKMCDYVLGTIAPEASCDKFEPDEKPRPRRKIPPMVTLVRPRDASGKWAQNTFDPSQPRNEGGEWTSGGGGGGSTTIDVKPEERGQIERRSKAATGRVLSDEELAGLVGAPKGSTVKISLDNDRYRPGIAIIAEHPDIEDQAVARLQTPTQTPRDLEMGRTSPAELHYEQVFLKEGGNGSSKHECCSRADRRPKRFRH